MFLTAAVFLAAVVFLAVAVFLAAVDVKRDYLRDDLTESTPIKENIHEHDLK